MKSIEELTRRYSRYSLEKDEGTSSSSRDNSVLSDRKFVSFSKIHSRVPLAQPKLDLPEEDNRLGSVLERLLSLTEDDRKSEKAPEKVISKFNSAVDVEKVKEHFENSERLRKERHEQQDHLRKTISRIDGLDIYSGVVHKSLYHFFKTSDGTADMASAQILTEIISWYLPKKGSNLEKRFKSEFLHMKYRDFQEAHGCTRKEVEISLKKLKSLGLIETFLEDIECVVGGRRKVLANRMMIKLNAEKVAEIIPSKRYTKRGKRKSSYDRIKFFEPEGIEIKSWKEADDYIADVQSKLSALEFYNGKIPREFFQTFVNKTGYSNRLSSALMTKIVTLYLPKEAGVVSKRFFHDLLHFTYEDLQNHFNVSRKQLQYAFRILKDAGVIDIGYEVTTRLKKGVKVSFSNSMMIRLHIDRLCEILPAKTVRACGTVDHSKSTDPYTVLPGVHTENPSTNFSLHGTNRSFPHIKPYALKEETCTYVSPLVTKVTFPPRGGEVNFNNLSLSTGSDSRLKPYTRKPDRGKRKFISTESGIEGVLWGDIRRPWVQIVRERSILRQAIEDFEKNRRFFVSRAISKDFKMNRHWEKVGLESGISQEQLRIIFKDFVDRFSRPLSDGGKVYKENWFKTWKDWCERTKQRQSDIIPNYEQGESYPISKASRGSTLGKGSDRLQRFKRDLLEKIGESSARNILRYSRVYFDGSTLMISTDCAVTGKAMESLSDESLREVARADVCITINHSVFPGGKKVRFINC